MLADMSEIDDDARVARQLLYDALIEIRYLAAWSKRAPEEQPPAEALEQIHFLADLVHNLPSIARGSGKRPRQPRDTKPPSRRMQAMEARPMSWTWFTSSPEKQAWITEHLEAAELQWTPPPPLPTPRKGIPELTIRQRISVLAGWPVKTPPGCKPLPRQALVLKALDTEAYLALCQEASRRRLGWGGYSPWLRAHVDPDATHYIVPDPADYYWPDPPSRSWWQCKVILRMSDGEQVNGGLAVMPQTFLALPSTVPRRQQRRLALSARLIERDTYLWSRGHKAECTPQRCGYAPLSDE